MGYQSFWLYLQFSTDPCFLIRISPALEVSQQNESSAPPHHVNKLALLIMTVAFFMIEWGLLPAQGYLVAFALANRLRPALYYQVVLIMNAGSFFGRWAPSLWADMIGRFKTMVLMITLCMITTFGLWLPAALVSPSSLRQSLLISFALLFGFPSGSKSLSDRSARVNHARRKATGDTLPLATPLSVLGLYLDSLSQERS